MLCLHVLWVGRFSRVSINIWQNRPDSSWSPYLRQRSLADDSERRTCIHFHVDILAVDGYGGL